MDMVKIGTFIAKIRKEKGLTQQKLAEKLNVSDRAVSKWERGINLPDSSIMIHLCKILGISVNELLTGDYINDDNYINKAEENLLSLKEKYQKSNKELLKMEIVIGYLSSITFLTLIFIVSFIDMSIILKVGLIILALIEFIIGISFAIELERKVGYYECKHCSNKFIPEFLPFYFSMHIARTRYLKCPKCKKKSWMRKTLIK